MIQYELFMTHHIDPQTDFGVVNFDDRDSVLTDLHDISDRQLNLLVLHVPPPYAISLFKNDSECKYYHPDESEL